MVEGIDFLENEFEQERNCFKWHRGIDQVVTNYRPGQKQKSITNGRSTFTCERDGSALLESRPYKTPFLAATSARSLDRTADSISPSLAPFVIIIFLNIDDDDQVTKLAFKLPLSLWVRTLLLYSPQPTPLRSASFIGHPHCVRSTSFWSRNPPGTFLCNQSGFPDGTRGKETHASSRIGLAWKSNPWRPLENEALTIEENARTAVVLRIGIL